MKNKGVADYYDKFYSDDKKPFGEEPLPLVKVLEEHLPAGKILEIGAGSGRNSLYLAAQGYDVLATDISPVAAELLAARAREKEVALKAEAFDIAEKDIEGGYDAVICTFTLHHLAQEDARLAIRKMQEIARPGGFNLITAFTKDGDFFRNNPDTAGFYLDGKEHLEGMYQGWEIIKSFEREGQARVLDAGGERQFNVFAGILARKAP